MKLLKDIDLVLARKVAESAALKAGRFLRRRENGFHESREKNGNDTYLDVDVSAEKLIIQFIRKKFVGHSFFCEESGKHIMDSEYTWIVDALDGSKNYKKRSPFYVVGLTLLKNQSPLFSVKYHPAEGGLIYGDNNIATIRSVLAGWLKLKERKIIIHPGDQLNKLDLFTHLSSTNQEGRKKTQQFLDLHRESFKDVFTLGSGMAAGSIVQKGEGLAAFMNYTTHPWDILPEVPITQGAGGVITDIHGNPLTMDSTSIIHANPEIHKQLLNLVT